jgi:hypothetical protein
MDDWQPNERLPKVFRFTDRNGLEILMRTDGLVQGLADVHSRAGS